MDTSIRTLLLTAQKHSGQEKNAALNQAYTLLRNVAENKPSVDTPEVFGQDLYVSCAELAFQNGLPDMAKECLKMFFMKPPPTNQFLCRAYLCQAQLLAPQNANSPDQLEKAVVYLVKAISLAKKNPRYHFLVYNASVLYWQFCRPFLKPHFRQYLAQSLHQVVKALDDIEDKDYEWRAQLMIALIECHFDAGHKQDASHIATAAASFIKQNVPSLYKQVFGMMVRNDLVESSKLHKDVKASPELSVYYKICKMKKSLEQNEQKDYVSDIQKLLNQLGVQSVDSSSRVQTGSHTSRGTQRPTTSPSPSRSSEKVMEDDREKETPSRKHTGKAGKRSPTPTSSKRIPPDCPDRPYLLLEVARLCMQLEVPEFAQDCVEDMKTCIVKEASYYLELEFLQCELIVKCLGVKQESYQKSAVEMRLQAMKRCEEGIMNAIRQGDPNVIQAGCVTQWNLALPLLQPNLHHLIRRHLSLIAEALQDIQSLLIMLRCQIHTELAKCEEDEEQIQVAMEHLKKALALDDANIYQERLQVALHRLELRSQLYQQPDRPEDQAAMIIEQARKADSGTMRMKRSLLVKAGEALAPDAFLLVLDSESDTKDVSSGKGPQTVIRQLAAKAQQFYKCTKKAEGHLKRLGDENDQERARLWADLAKTARKQEVWDVCRVACRFCLLYDDGRWKNMPIIKSDSPLPKITMQADSSTQMDSSQEEKKATTKVVSEPSSPDHLDVPLIAKDLIRMLAEVNFINGEATIHLLRSEQVELNDSPIPPEDKSKHPKGYIAKKPEEDPEWLEYCEWIKSLSETAINLFLRGLALGVELDESWLVCSAGSYLWNYSNHLLTQNRHREIISSFQTVLEGLKKVGHAGETIMLVDMCNALGFGLMKPWIPEQAPKEMVDPPMSPVGGDKSPSSKKSRGAPTVTKSKAGVVISSEAMPDLKKAIEIFEYAIGVTNGSNEHDVVPISVRMQLLQTWVAAKQMAQQQINKSLGAEDELTSEGQNSMTRAIVAVEMLGLTRNGIMEFKETPTVSDVVKMIEDSKWSDKFVELQLWARLTYLCHENRLHNLVLHCSEKALRFAVVGTQPKNRKMEAHKYMVEQEMLSYASGLLGQSLVENMSGKNAVRRKAMEAFLNSAKFAKNAENFSMVMTAARHYWNACIPLVGQPIERELLREPVKFLLKCISSTADKKVKKQDSSDGKDAEAIGSDVNDAEKQASLTIGYPEDDLTLRASLYGVLFQAYADKEQWEEALTAIDQAVNDMPRTKHRLLIFKHRVMVKAKLGRTVHMDIQKFKDENEDYVAHMWRRVALASKETLEQMSSYQLAIEALTSASSDWQKVEHLLEFAQWLYVNDFPLQDAIDQIEWAVDIIVNMQTEVTARKEAAKAAAASALDERRTAKGKRDAKRKLRSSAKPKLSPGNKSPSIESKNLEFASKQSDVKSELSDTESELNPSDYIPVAKEVIIGVLPANPNLTIEDFDDVKLLDGLVRAHVLLAELSGRGSMYYNDFCLMAHGFFMRIWQIILSEAGPVMKEIVKAAAAAANDASSTKGGKSKKDDKKKDPVKEKPKRKGPLDALPMTVEEWAVYELPEEIVEAFKHELMKETGINDQTIPKPMLSLYYLDKLIKMFRELGCSHLCLPMLCFEDLLSRDVLQNHSLSLLSHIRCQEICLELGLKAGYDFHERVMGSMKINEDEQAMSREEIAIWKEKQVQVAREEMRVKESLARIAEKSGENRHSAVKASKQISNKDEIEFSGYSHIGKTLGAIQLREVWTDIAEVLLRQGYYQYAREYLNEAHTAATVFEDLELQSRILLLLAQLAFKEAQYGQAISLCKSSQEVYHGDESYWFDSISLMVNAILKDHENRKAKKMARKILVHSLNEFLKVTEERPNRISVTGYILAVLEAKLASVQISVLLDDYDDINIPKVMKALLNACEKYEKASEKLIKLGYRREVLPIMKEHADILMKMARQATEKEIKHTYCLQSMGVLKESVTVAREMLQDTLSMKLLSEGEGVNFPTQRECCDILTQCGEVMLEMFGIHAKEVRNQQLEDQRKGSVLQMVEDYIRSTPNYTQMEKEWLENSKTVVEDALLLYSEAHTLAASNPFLKAKSLSGIGRCLKNICFYKSPDQPCQWFVQEMELSKITGNDGIGDGEEEEAMDTNSKEYHRYSNQIKKQKNLHAVSKQYLLKAVECLVQALNLSVQKKFVDLASVISLELVECCGQFDALAASNFMALHQSCQTSVYMEGMLRHAQLDPVTSRLAALLHQRSSILEADIELNLRSGHLMSSIECSLEQDWQAWKKIEVLANHVEFLKELPTNFNFVVLQHSPDKSYLYGAVLDKPKGHAGGGGGGKGNPKQQALQAPSRACIFGVETNAKLLDSLITKAKQHKHNVQLVLLKQEYQRTRFAMRQKMLENLEDDMKQQAQSQFAEGEEDENVLNDEFFQLVEDMEDYLRPIMQQLDTVLRPPSSSDASNTVLDKGNKDPPINNESLVLLADPDLMELPLESLQVLKSDNFVSICRDFSLQLFYHRFHKEQVAEEATPQTGKKKEKKEPVNVNSRIPGVREVKQKQTKIVPLDRSLQPWHTAVDTMNFRYMIDPHSDCPETEEHKPTEIFEKLLEEYENQFTPRWLGLTGDEHVPSVGEYEIYMSESSSFVFYGMERLLSHIPAGKISALNLPECMLMFLLDLTQTNKSFQRQAKIDVLKSGNLLALEKPVETALLLSLTGIKCIMANQWHCTLAENADRLTLIMKDMLEKGRTSGEAVHLQVAPYHRKPDQEEPEQADSKVSESKGSDKKTPSTDKDKKRPTSDKRGHSRDRRSVSSEPKQTGLDESISSNVDPDKDTEEPKVEEELKPKREWFNMVCYGLPSLVITQL